MKTIIYKRFNSIRRLYPDKFLLRVQKYEQGGICTPSSQVLDRSVTLKDSAISPLCFLTFAFILEKNFTAELEQLRSLSKVESKHEKSL